MRETKVKIQFQVDFKKILSSFFIWMCGILINILPLFYKMLKAWFSSENNPDYFLLFWSDIDFLCINFSVAFLLLIEIYFLHLNNKKILKGLGGLLLFVTIVLIAAYTIATFAPEWTSRVSAQTMKTINIITLIFIIVMGIVYFVTVFSKVQRRVVL